MWQVGFAQKFLDRWEHHERNFVPMLVGRLDFGEKIDSMRSEAEAAGDDPVAIHTLFKRLERAHLEQGRPVADQLLDMLQHATDRKLLDTFDVQDPLMPVGGKVQKWRTGIHAIDHMTEGGGYGLTVFGGQPKLGKSLAAMGAGLTACAEDWLVVYVNAELTEREMHHRITRFLRRPGCPVTSGHVHQNFMLVNVNPGFSIEQLLPQIQQTVGLDTHRIMIVLDSVNRLAEGDAQAGDAEFAYFHRLRAWSEWPRIATRMSDGRLSFLAVSELNRKDQIKGGGLEYGANLVVRFTKAGESTDIVEIDVALSRETRSGPCGEHRREWETARFVSNMTVGGGGANWDE